MLKDQLQSPLESVSRLREQSKKQARRTTLAFSGRLMVEELEEQMARQLIRSGEGGQALIEYVFILVLVAMVVIVVLMIFGPQLGNAFSTITHGL